MVFGFFCLLLIACTAPESQGELVSFDEQAEGDGYVLRSDISNVNDHLDYTNSDLKAIYFAGGCFWGVEAYMQKLYGVSEASSGYANGIGENPSYEEVMKGDLEFVETVEVIYDPERVSLKELIHRLFLVIDPTTRNKQGNDVGIQYRTGIYYVDKAESRLVEEAIESEQSKYDAPIVTEAVLLESFYLAEEFHQDYLEKNPDGYCHINLDILDSFTINPIEADETIIENISVQAAK